MYHTASLAVPTEYTTLHSDVGLTISNFVYYTDSDTSDYLLDDSVKITANWTDSTIQFSKSLVNNWWHGEFDTTAIVGGHYVVVVSAYRPFFDNVSAQFIVIATEQATVEITNAGGAPIETSMNEVFTLEMEYQLLNGSGILNALFYLDHSGPDGELSWSNFTDYSNGQYSVDIQCTQAATFPITISLNKTFHHTASDSFYLIVNNIETNFTALNGTAGIVEYGSDYRLVVSYTNSTGYGLDGADIAIESIAPESGLSWGSIIPETSGIYSILLTPSTTNTFTLLIKASLLNHQIQYIRFTLTSTEIASNLIILNASAVISFDQNYTVYVQYQSEDFDGLENASLSIQNPPTDVNNTSFEELGNGYYRVTLTPLEIGSFDIIFRAELQGYQSDTAAFVISSQRIQTQLQFSNGISSNSIQFLDSCELVVIFERTDFNQTIDGAIISLLASPTIGLDWFSYVESGEYHIRVEPEHVGRWILTVSASKTGYTLGSVQFILDVEPVRVDTQLLTLPSAVEGVEFPIEVSVTHEGTSIPVSGALVEFRITAEGSPLGAYQAMTETDTPGVYRAMYAFPLYQSVSNYELEIRMNKDNYEMNVGSFTSPFQKSEDVVLRLVPVATGSGLLLILLIGSVIGIRVNNTRKRRRNLEALQVKKRFDDVSNILGIITLHKKSGLPIYSKILKGGIESAMVSAFITAITHFRAEFEMDKKRWEFNVIPISDIISAVPTRSFIVAFITVRPPSKYQASAMEAFGRATGALYDEILADTKVGLIDPSQTEIFDTLFYDLLDGILIERFRTSKDASFPKSMECLVNAAQQLENGEGFNLEDLAAGMATCGIEETYAYKIVMDAIDENLIEVIIEPESDVVPAPPPETEISELDEDDGFIS